MKCGVCGKKLKKVDNIELKGFKIRGFECSCGHELVEPEDIDNIVKFFRFIKKQKKLKVFKSGDSLAIRIPKAIADIYRIHENDEIIIDPKKDGIVLKVTY